MSRIELKNIDKFYGNNHVLRNINLTIEDGDFMTLLGPSGCGKTTTLRVVSGLEKPQNGIMTIDGVEMINADDAYYAEPSKRGLNLVFQSYALWPHMTVYNNISFGLKIQKMSHDEIDRRVMDSLRMMRIDMYKDRYPTELSGGQQQRVAIARAVASSPKLLLLDEPLSNLDAKLRIDMRSELQRLHKELGTTIIYVTHDQVEALTMSTRIALFRKGELVQVAPPLELYDNPCNLYTADFIGNPSINFIKGSAKADASGMTVDSVMGQQTFARADMTPEAPKSGAVEVTLGLRPEQVTISKVQDDEHRVEARVYSGMPAGSETLVTVRVGKELVTVKELGSTHYGSDEKVYLGFNPKKINVFDKASESLIKYCV